MRTRRLHSHIRHSRLLVAIVALGLMLLTTYRAAAHHGWAGYVSDELELSGTLETPLSLGNPHATMRVRVDDQIWDIVLAPPARTASAGLKEGIIPVGAMLNDIVSLVTGASRGAGRGIALELGSAGATGYVSGRSVDGRPTTDDVPRTIDQTADVESLFDHIRRDHGRLDCCRHAGS
jgi:hypothetical protein